MRLVSNILVLLSISICAISCDDTPKPADTIGKGTIDISADETYKPVIDEQKKVFDSSYPEAHVNIHYKPEAECFKDYFEGKARLILVTRELSKTEKEFSLSKKIFPSGDAVAGDGIAVLVSNESKDTVLDRAALTGILSGNYNRKVTVVFDNQESSTVRFITDSVLKGGKLGANVFAAKGNKEVIDYIAKNPEAIGFVGMGYVYANEDTSRAGTFINNVRVVAIRNEQDGHFYKPYQAYVAQKLYPLTRKLYYVSAESHHGLGTGFANFLSSHSGQLIFLHEHFFPLKENIVIRDVNISH